MSYSQLILKRKLEKLAMLTSTSGPSLRLASSPSSNPNDSFLGANGDAESESGDEKSVDSDNDATALTSRLSTTESDDDEDDDDTKTNVSFQCRSCHATILNSQSISDAAQKHLDLCWRSSSVSPDNSKNDDATLTPMDIESASFQPSVVIKKITTPKNSNKVTTATTAAATLPVNDERRSSLNRAMAKLKESTIALLSASDDDDDVTWAWDGNEMKEDLVRCSKKRSKKSKRRSKSSAGADNNRKSTAHRCSFCPGRFHLKKVLEKHLATVHCEGATNILTCPICHRMMDKRLTFQSHLSRHVNAEDVEIAFHLWSRWPNPKNGRKVLQFSCKFCLLPLISHPHFMNHMRECHPEMEQFQSYGCDYCEKKKKETEKFDTMRKLLAHIRSEHVDEYQGETKRDPEEVWVETRSPEGRPRPKSKCKFCNRLIDRWYMPAHIIRRHSSNDGKGPGVNGRSSGSRGLASNLFECPVKNCGAKLKNVGLLKMHFILHLENNPYVCPVPGCVVKCDALCHLNRHLKLHRGKSHPCPKCGVGYSRIDKLRDHQKQCELEDGNSQDKKVWIDEQGMKRPLNSFHRLRRLTEKDEKIIEDHRRKIKARGSINQMISTDPVFIQVCKENPDFKEVILGKCKGRLSKEVERSEAEIKASTCTLCGKVLFNSMSMRRHWKLIHNVILDEVKIETRPKSKSKSKSRSIGGGGRKKKRKQNPKNKDLIKSNQTVVKIEVEKELNIPLEGESEFYFGFGDYNNAATDDLKPNLDETKMKPSKLELLEELDHLLLPLPEVAVKKEEIDD